MKEVFAILILCAPLIQELINDSMGDFNKRFDVVVRCVIAVFVALWVRLLTDHHILLALNLSLAIHFMFFDYLVHILLYRNGVIVSPKWFNVLGKSGKWDNILIWKNIGPYGRLFVKLFYVLVSIWAYFKF